jgi:hypothetical protein
MPDTFLTEALKNSSPEPDRRSCVLIAMGPEVVDMTALTGAIGARLRTLHADMLNEEIPKKIAELTAQLDQTTRNLILREQVGSDQRACAQRR